ncbi:MAG: hypothetical protein KDA96_23665, partial [Planctomycetaceae bacterium]|nr:hypothetical protein [Planctomycetaceae bacterium]
MRLPIPAAEFSTSGFERREAAEIVRWKNKYDYAMKMHEYDRLRHIAKNALEVARQLRFGPFFAIAGSLFATANELTPALESFAAGAAMNDRKCLLGAAAVAARCQDWPECSHYLRMLLLHAPLSTVEDRDRIHSLGSCLTYLENRELTGLAAIARNATTPETISAAQQVLAYSLYDRDSRAAALAASGRLSDVQQRFPDSPVFANIERREDATASVDLPGGNPSEDGKPETPVSLPPSIPGRISAYYPREGMGFVTADSTRRTYRFHIGSVVDENLSRDLALNRSGQNVMFAPVRQRSGFTEYDQAHRIQMREVEKNHRSTSRPTEGRSSAVSPAG